MNLKLKNLNKQSIEIVIPKEKENLYYESTDKLNRFDLVQIFYVDSHRRLFILENILIDVIKRFLDKTLGLINGHMEIKERFEVGQFGQFYNQLFFDMCLSNAWDKDIFSTYILWSGINFQIVMYSFNYLVYIEIFPVFSFGEDSSDEEDKESFKKFMENYTPVGVMKLDKDILQQWRKEVKDFFELENDIISY